MPTREATTILSLLYLYQISRFVLLVVNETCTITCIITVKFQNIMTKTVVVEGYSIKRSLAVSLNLNACVCVFVYEVVYETKSKFPCCLVGTSQFDGQNFYGPLCKKSVKTWNYHNRYFNCNAAQYSKTEYLVFAPIVHLVRVKKIYIYWDIWHTNTRS